MPPPMRRSPPRRHTPPRRRGTPPRQSPTRQRKRSATPPRSPRRPRGGGKLMLLQSAVLRDLDGVAIELPSTDILHTTILPGHVVGVRFATSEPAVSVNSEGALVRDEVKDDGGADIVPADELDLLQYVADAMPRDYSSSTLSPAMYNLAETTTVRMWTCFGRITGRRKGGTGRASSLTVTVLPLFNTGAPLLQPGEEFRITPMDVSVLPLALNPDLRRLRRYRCMGLDSPVRVTTSVPEGVIEGMLRGDDGSAKPDGATRREAALVAAAAGRNVEHIQDAREREHRCRDTVNDVDVPLKVDEGMWVPVEALLLGAEVPQTTPEGCYQCPADVHWTCQAGVDFLAECLDFVDRDAGMQMNLVERQGRTLDFEVVDGRLTVALDASAEPHDVVWLRYLPPSAIFTVGDISTPSGAVTALLRDVQGGLTVVTIRLAAEPRDAARCLSHLSHLEEHCVTLEEGEGDGPVDGQGVSVLTHPHRSIPIPAAGDFIRCGHTPSMSALLRGFWERAELVRKEADGWLVRQEGSDSLYAVSVRDLQPEFTVMVPGDCESLRSCLSTAAAKSPAAITSRALHACGRILSVVDFSPAWSAVKLESNEPLHCPAGLLYEHVEYRPAATVSIFADMACATDRRHQESQFCQPVLLGRIRGGRTVTGLWPHVREVRVHFSFSPGQTSAAGTSCAVLHPCPNSPDHLWVAAYGTRILRVPCDAVAAIRLYHWDETKRLRSDNPELVRLWDPAGEVAMWLNSRQSRGPALDEVWDSESEDEVEDDDGRSGGQRRLLPRALLHLRPSETLADDAHEAESDAALFGAGKGGTGFGRQAVHPDHVVRVHRWRPDPRITDLLDAMDREEEARAVAASRRAEMRRREYDRIAAEMPDVPQGGSWWPDGVKSMTVLPDGSIELEWSSGKTEHVSRATFQMYQDSCRGAASAKSVTGLEHADGFCSGGLGTKTALAAVVMARRRRARGSRCRSDEAAMLLGVAAWCLDDMEPEGSAGWWTWWRRVLLRADAGDLVSTGWHWQELHQTSAVVEMHYSSDLQVSAMDEIVFVGMQVGSVPSARLERCRGGRSPLRAAGEVVLRYPPLWGSASPLVRGIPPSRLALLVAFIAKLSKTRLQMKPYVWFENSVMEFVPAGAVPDNVYCRPALL
eukprot:TRINITY_DN39952_c0_g1_i1.p1 TRINITY_DN39952_c0_g1~~TRINITY_DN39952_c0_g1_i1.p1  ORF type:complete len:1164 (+),score=264.07 TRINITY_DN39952_c0_g1_i1:57-3494(+)